MPQIEITVGELDPNTRLFPLLVQVRDPIESETIQLMLAAPWADGFEIVSLRHKVGVGSLDALVKIEGSQVRFTADTAAGVPTSAPPGESTHTPDQTAPAHVFLNEALTLETVNLGTGTESYICQFNCRLLKPVAA